MNKISKSRSKWRKHVILSEDQQIAENLPKTMVLTAANFRLMAANHKHVILKPSGGAKGVGIIKVAYLGDSQFDVHFESSKQTITGLQQLFTYIKQITQAKSYVIQQYIDLTKVNNRPIDFRIMLQRIRSSPWKITARVAKVAGEGYFVTNNCRSNGTVLPIDTAIEKSSLDPDLKPTLMHKVDKVALQAVKALEQAYPNMVIVGYDLGIDQEGNIWIIEANMNPGTSLFHKMQDKTMYRRIWSFKRANRNRSS
jgi:hypothetical protein